MWKLLTQVPKPTITTKIAPKNQAQRRFTNAIIVDISP